jgi:fluoride exporter
MRLLIVALGGAIGSACRYLTSLAVQSIAPSIPLTTFIVNFTGCFAIGALSRWQETSGDAGELWRLFLMVGILGGFTTFSAFGNETALLVRQGRAALAMANVAAHMILALGAVWAGRACVTQ